MKNDEIGELKKSIKKKEKEINRLNNIEVMLNTVLDSIAGIHWWKDVNGVYLGCNQAMADALGLNSRDDIIGKTDYELPWSNQADILVKNDKIVMESGVVQRGKEEPVTTNDGNSRTFMVAKAVLHNTDGEVIGTVGNSIDITKQKQLTKDIEIEKQKAESASHAKSEFIANMSHDIRTPMTGISGMLDELLLATEDVQSTLQADPKPSVENLKKLLQDLVARTREYAEVAKHSTYELMELFNQILETIRLESGKIDMTPETFDLRALVQHSRNLLQSVADHKKLNFSIDIDDRIPRYFDGLGQYLDRTLLNLMSNALKFTETGAVNVTVALTDPSEKPYVKGDPITLQIQVKDTGIGIPEDRFDVIFEHFSRLTPSYQGVYKGSGLGLYAVKRYVEAMQGYIEVDSAVDKGSCFTLTLPFTVEDHADLVRESIQTPTPTERSAAKKTATTTLARVLLVEDNPAAAMATCLALKRFQCEVEVAENGGQAIEKASQETYDLIFMDVGLPDADGVEVTKRIRHLSDAKKSQVPIVALTGHAGGDQRQACFAAGMNDVLTKPAQPLALQSALQHWVWDKGPVNDQSTALSTALEETVIDWEGCVRMCFGDVDFARKLLLMMVKDLKNTQTILTEAYPNQDMKALRAELHRCLGGVVYLRLPELEQSIKAFQAAVKAEPQCLDELETTYADVQNAIETFWETMEKKDFD